MGKPQSWPTSLREVPGNSVKMPPLLPEPGLRERGGAWRGFADFFAQPQFPHLSYKDQSCVPSSCLSEPQGEEMQPGQRSSLPTTPSVSPG